MAGERYITTGQNNWSGPSPSGLTREDIHGQLARDEAPLERIKPWLGTLSKWLFWLSIGGGAAFIFWPVARFGFINLGAGW